MSQISVNKLDLSGEISNSILRETSTGKPVCNFTLILTDRFKAERPVRQFIRAVAWQGLGQRIAEMKDGTKVRVRGRLETTSWQDKKKGNAWVHRLQVVCDSAEPVPHLQATPSQAEIDQRPITDEDLPF